MPQNRVTNDRLMDRFDAIYPVYRVAFARLLLTLRRDFDGDLDAMIVLLTMSLGTEREDWANALLGEHDPVPQTRLTNTQSISLASGIPRETVRRKLVAMEARGWISRDERGNWSPTAEASRALRSSSQETISFIRALATVLTPPEAEAPRKTPRTTP